MDSNFQYAEAVKLVVALFLAPVAWDRSARRFGVAPCSLAGYVLIGDGAMPLWGRLPGAESICTNGYGFRSRPVDRDLCVGAHDPDIAGIAFLVGLPSKTPVKLLL